MSRLHDTPPAALAGLLCPGVVAAVEQVEAAREQVVRAAVDVDEVAARVLATAQIPWSGPAGDAWRGRMTGAGRDVRGGVVALDELAGRLTVLADRLRAS